MTIQIIPPRMYKSFPLLLFLFLSATSLLAQIELSDDFISQLASAKVEFLQPLENRFKNIKVNDNEFQTYELALKHRKEKVEIRYAIEPIVKDPSKDIPPIFFTNKIIHLAANTDDSILSIHGMQNTELQETFNADWGAIAFFHPKPEFSTKQHCKTIAVHAEGKGNIYIFYLFNDPKIDLEEVHANVRFMD